MISYTICLQTFFEVVQKNRFSKSKSALSNIYDFLNDFFLINDRSLFQSHFENRILSKITFLKNKWKNLNGGFSRRRFKDDLKRKKFMLTFSRENYISRKLLIEKKIRKYKYILKNKIVLKSIKQALNIRKISKLKNLCTTSKSANCFPISDDFNLLNDLDFEIEIFDQNIFFSFEKKISFLIEKLNIKHSNIIEIVLFLSKNQNENILLSFFLLNESASKSYVLGFFKNIKKSIAFLKNYIQYKVINNFKIKVSGISFNLKFFLTSNFNIFFEFDDRYVGYNDIILSYPSIKLNFLSIDDSFLNFERLSCFTSKHFLFMRISDTLFDLLVKDCIERDKVQLVGNKDFRIDNLKNLNRLKIFLKQKCSFNFKLKIDELKRDIKWRNLKLSEKKKLFEKISLFEFKENGTKIIRLWCEFYRILFTNKEDHLKHDVANWFANFQQLYPQKKITPNIFYFSFLMEEFLSKYKNSKVIYFFNNHQGNMDTNLDSTKRFDLESMRAILIQKNKQELNKNY